MMAWQVLMWDCGGSAGSPLRSHRPQASPKMDIALTFATCQRHTTLLMCLQVWLMASVVAWMFTSASCVAVMEKMVWHDALYFVASTLTTVGYGDVVVKSSMGKGHCLMQLRG